MQAGTIIRRQFEGGVEGLQGAPCRARSEQGGRRVEPLALVRRQIRSAGFAAAGAFLPVYYCRRFHLVCQCSSTAGQAIAPARRGEVSLNPRERKGNFKENLASVKPGSYNPARETLHPRRVTFCVLPLL